MLIYSNLPNSYALIILSILKSKWEVQQQFSFNSIEDSIIQQHQKKCF